MHSSEAGEVKPMKLLPFSCLLEAELKIPPPWPLLTTA